MFELNNFDSIQIAIAGPDKIREWSRGEVTKSETINYRTQKPERDGLFCEKIFGPKKDWECSCGKYKRTRHKGVTCDKCGVEVTRAKVRRERMGHIELAAPVTHIWYFRGVPSRIGLLLDAPPKALEQVVYFIQHIVLDPGETELKFKEVISEQRYSDMVEKYGAGSFRTGMGAEAVMELLQNMDVEKEYKEVLAIVEKSTGPKKLKAIKRLEILNSFLNTPNDPTWMVLTVLPVMPPELRPMVQLDGGRFATSDLNDLYRRVINRNNRLKRLMELNAPEIIMRNEKRMLQEAVDALIDNGRKGKPVTGAGGRELKSLSGLLRGKQGRFRQNLLGKRVDYSGRSVIVVGPELKMYQCGLPKEMALELFKPFVMKELVARNKTQNHKTARRIVERADDEVWGYLENVIKEHPVLLNRAPTLHRLGIQAFEPVLVEGRAIKLHPLACGAFNADFDGDQMAVHVPLSIEAQTEARVLMLASNNILKLSDGRPVCSPSQDMIIGCYYLTIEKPGAKGEGKVFADIDEAKMAYANKYIELQTRIKVRIFKEFEGVTKSKIIDTTLGRIIFNEAIPQDLGFVKRETHDDMFALEVNESMLKGDVDKDDPTAEVKGKAVRKQELQKIVEATFKAKGATETSVVLDKIKALGFKYSTIGAITTSIFDMHIPPEKKPLMAEAEENVIQIEKLFDLGHMTREEKHTRTTGVWENTNKLVQKAVKKTLDEFNPINMMAVSGARGSINQIAQLSGMRGLMTDPRGRTLETPVRSSFREGLSVLEYFISSHGGRKGLADTALNTAKSGYLTRRLVDVAQDVIITTDDCFNGAAPKGLKITSIFETNEDEMILTKPAASVLSGTYAAENIFDPITRELYIATGELISDEVAKKIANSTIVKLTVSKTKLTLIEAFENRMVGRFTAEDVINPKTKEIIVPVNHMITDADAKAIKDAGLVEITIRTLLTCTCRHGVCAKCYGKDMAASNVVRIGEAVGVIAAQSIGEPGTQLTMRTFHTGGVASADDITQGLPRVDALIRASDPKNNKKDAAIIAEFGGIVKVDEREDKCFVYVRQENGKEDKYSVPHKNQLRKRIVDGREIKAGDAITKGYIYSQDILRTQSKAAVQFYMLKEIQSVYSSQSIMINDKHIEIIVRQMLKKVKVEDGGDTGLLPGELVDHATFAEANNRAIEAGLRPGFAKQKLQGTIQAALATESFLSASSFQETAKVLTDAAIKNKIDPLRGLKENVIIGKLIPAGTGMKKYKHLYPIEIADPIEEMAVTEDVEMEQEEVL